VPAAEARARITAATARLLDDRPFRELTVDAVMAEAGLARTVFYRHFDGLPGIVLALLEELRDDVLGQARVIPPGERAAILRSSLAATVDGYARHHGLLLALDHAARHDVAVEQAYCAIADGAIAGVAAVIEDGIARGELRPLPAFEVARGLALLNNTYLLDAFGREPPVTPEAALEALWTIWSRTVGLD
jgi:AcrR family transcriptional regulator